jgi:Amt family ammonium transporter
MFDFAGGAVVHSVGGWAALAGVLVLGPRVGKYSKDGKIHPIPGHNMSLATIGAFVLWLGWFGFNPGSTMAADPGAISHIVMTTNTAGIMGILASTATAWLVVGKPDLGMTINGCLAGLVGITGSCAYVSVTSSIIIGAIAGVIVVFAVLFFDRVKIDDPVGATSVHLVCGTFGTICIGLFAEEGVTSLSKVNGLFFGGGLSLLGKEVLGIIAVGIFVFISSALIWLLLKKTIGIRVSLEEEIQGLDIGEHGNSAYPDFAITSPIMDSENENGNGASIMSPAEAEKPASGAVSPDVAIPVVNQAHPGAKMTKVTIITNQDKFTKLQSSLDNIGITGLTVTNVLGYGMQKGNTEYYRGAPVKTRLLPKIQVDIVVCKIPTKTLVETAKEALYTGNIGDGKIFIYDVENVIKIRTGEEGYDTLQDEEDE